MNWEWHLTRMAGVAVGVLVAFVALYIPRHFHKAKPIPKPAQWISTAPDLWKPNPDVPETDATNAIAYPLPIDWNKINPENKGYHGDLNGDGIPDFVIFTGDTLYWKQSEKGELKPLLKVRSGSVVAYTIGELDGKGKPVFMYFTEDHKGWYRPSLGTNTEGIPFFGEAEAAK